MEGVFLQPEKIKSRFIPRPGAVHRGVVLPSAKGTRAEIYCRGTGAVGT
jgi:hypothetical protein